MLVKQFWLSRSLPLSIKLYVLLSLTLFTLEIFSNFCEAIRWIEPYYIALFAGVSSVFCVLFAFLAVLWLIPLCFFNISSLTDNGLFFLIFPPWPIIAEKKEAARLTMI